MILQQPYNSNHYKLVNFNVPNHLINSFDEMVKFKRLSRTSTLISLMEGWLRNEVRKMDEDDKFNDLVMDLKTRNRQTTHLQRQTDEELPPSPIFTNNYSWEDTY